MTKEQFLSGASFRVKGFGTCKGASTYKYDECIIEENRSSLDERVILSSYHLNVSKIGKVGFEGFCFVMNKRVVVKYKFEELVIFED